VRAGDVRSPHDRRITGTSRLHRFDSRAMLIAASSWHGRASSSQDGHICGVASERLSGVTCAQLAFHTPEYQRLEGARREGNHGEDVREYWLHVDSAPTHSYMKLVCKYLQRAFPSRDLVSTNRNRSKLDMEYELLDTGIFNEDRYFDVVVQVTAHNRGRVKTAGPRREPAVSAPDFRSPPKLREVRRAACPQPSATLEWVSRPPGSPVPIRPAMPHAGSARKSRAI
jgi:hypothetical protein